MCVKYRPKGEIKMVEYVTPEKLISQWWMVKDPGVTREELDNADWDELLALLEIECIDCAGLNIKVVDFDREDGRWLVIFELLE